MAGYYIQSDFLNVPPQLPLATLTAADTAVLPSLVMVMAPVSAERGMRGVQNSGNAYLSATWTDVYFGRIHLTPQLITLGVVASAVERTITIWNARLTATSLTNITGANDDGFAFTGLPTLPRVLRPTEELTITLVGSEQGPPIIEALFSLIFTSETKSLFVGGLRARVLAHEPDWSESVQVSRRWRTVIQEGLTGKEARSSTSAKVLRDLSFTVNAFDATESQQLKFLILMLGRTSVGMPVWTDSVELTAPATTGATVLTTWDTANYALDSEFLIIWKSETIWEVRKRGVVAGTSVGLLEGLNQAYPTGTRVMPVLFGRLSGLPKVELLTDEAVSVPIEFEEKF